MLQIRGQGKAEEPELECLLWARPDSSRRLPDLPPGAPGPWGLQLLGDDKVSEHVEGVAVRMHSHDLAVLLVDLKEPGIVQAHDPHLGPLLTSQADLLSTEKEAARGYRGCNAVV